jgi:hypothetical protein
MRPGSPRGVKLPLIPAVEEEAEGGLREREAPLFHPRGSGAEP